MSDIIHLLPDSIANQIAAGEVIQRPASAVKELMENSIDAGSASIALIVRDAGKTLLQVVDNGCGMSETDARMSFERHATSKIRTIDDLFAIRTMGFRGEALASIAAVAQVELKTKKTEEEIGTHLIVEGSEVKLQEPCQTPAGTNLSVKNLFYNVPARRNFLRSNPVEMRHIIEEFQRIALAHPDIFFSLTHNDMEIFHLKPGKLRQRITSIFGSSSNERLVPVDEQTGVVKILGYIGKPDFARKTRGEQYFFVNGRFIRNNYLSHAVFINFEELIPNGSYPFFVLFIDIEPATIDINVHPTKQEIKFEDEKLVYGFVRAAVRHALAKYSVTPTIDFEQEQALNELQAQGFLKTKPLAAPVESVEPERSQGGFSARFETRQSKNWEQLYEVAAKDGNAGLATASIFMAEADEEEILVEKAQNEPIQIHNRFILSQIKSGFIVIDQQAAHERILYERYLRALNRHTPGSQKQLFPKSVTFSPDDAVLLKQILPEINAMGFDVQEFGNDTFVVHGLPSDIEVNEGDEQAMLEQLLENYKNNLAILKLDKRDGLARSLAQQASIKSGKQLSVKEMKSLIDELFACEQPYIAPNKRNTFLTFDFDEMEKRFAQK